VVLVVGRGYSGGEAGFAELAPKAEVGPRAVTTMKTAPACLTGTMLDWEPGPPG